MQSGRGSVRERAGSHGRLRRGRRRFDTGRRCLTPSTLSDVGPRWPSRPGRAVSRTNTPSALITFVGLEGCLPRSWEAILVDVYGELSNLAALHERGLLTVGEFNEAKAQLFSRAQSEGGAGAGLSYGSATVENDSPAVVLGRRPGAAAYSQSTSHVPLRRRKGWVLAAGTVVVLGLGGAAAYQVASARALGRAAEAERVRVAEFNFKPTGPVAGLIAPDDRMVELNFVTAWTARSLEQRATMCAGYAADSDQVWEIFDQPGNTFSRPDFEYLFKKYCRGLSNSSVVAADTQGSTADTSPGESDDVGSTSDTVEESVETAPEVVEVDPQVALVDLQADKPRHTFGEQMGDSDEPWVISFKADVIHLWSWNPASDSWKSQELGIMSGVEFEWIEQVDVTGDGQDDFLLQYTSEGDPAASVVVNLGDRAEWADLQGLDGEEHGGAYYLEARDGRLVSDYGMYGYVSDPGEHEVTSWAYQERSGDDLFIEKPL